MTETDICNLALGMLAHDRTVSSDFRTATSTEAARCRLFFDACRRRVLGAHAWIFAETPATLCRCAAPAAGCPSGWHAFATPPDCLNIIRAADPHAGPVDFMPCGASVSCPCVAAAIVYVRDVTDLAEWPQPALDALASELAARLAGPMTGSAEKAAAFRKDAARELAAAEAWNARQAPQKPTADNRYAAARNGRECDRLAGFCGGRA